MSTALLTDQYELTMLEAARRSGVASHRAVFEVFARDLPPGRRYGVVAGMGRLLEAIEAFRFGPAELEWLAERRVVSADTLDWLAGYQFSGDVDGYAEGELFFPSSPVLTVEGSFGEAVLLETLVLSVLNHDSAVAAAAARMVAAARGRTLVEMGGRRTHEGAAVAAARAAFVAGFDSTSNLEAGRRHGIPTAGTSAHAFTLAHAEEGAAFTAQLAALGVGTTLLVDTFDIESGTRAAVAAARAVGAKGPGAVRIDSGDPIEQSRRVRALLDGLGATTTRIVVSGDLDEYAIARFEGAAGGRAPIDAYGVGTRVVTGSGAPTADMIYKLVAIADRPGADAALRAVSKRSEAKLTRGGRKTASRLLDARGLAVAEEVVVDGADLPAGDPSPGRGFASSRRLQIALIRGGGMVHDPGLEEIRAHHRAALAELGPDARTIDAGPPALEPRLLAAEVSA